MILMQAEVNEEVVTFGAYSTHALIGADSKGKDICTGDDTCFMFNLNGNLRFNTKPCLKDPTCITTSDTSIRFGYTDLVIFESFSKVSSHIDGAMFRHGDELAKERVDSVVPGQNEIKLLKVEVWVLQENFTI